MGANEGEAHLISLLYDAAAKVKPLPATEAGQCCAIGKAARTDLCGGRGEISVPTATVAGIRLERRLSGDKLPSAAIVHEGRR